MPTSYGALPLGQSVTSGRISSTVQSSGLGNSTNQSKSSNFVRVVAVNDDGSVYYEPLVNNTKKSDTKPSGNLAKLGSNNINSIPKVKEIIEIYSAPDISLSFNKTKPEYSTYYRPTSLNIWNNQNNNIILDPTVPGQVNDNKMANVNLENYNKSLNGFV